MRRKRTAIFGATFAIGAMLLFVGNFHVVTGSSPRTPQLVKRVSFSFSEFWVNSDELMSLPMIVARAKYPLILLALERDSLAEERRVFSKLPSQEEKEKAVMGIAHRNNCIGPISVTFVGADGIRERYSAICQDKNVPVTCEFTGALGALDESTDTDILYVRKNGEREQAQACWLGS